MVCAKNDLMEAHEMPNGKGRFKLQPYSVFYFVRQREVGFFQTTLSLNSNLSATGIVGVRECEKRNASGPKACPAGTGRFAGNLRKVAVAREREHFAIELDCFCLELACCQ
jgi:hypothetical protein